MFKYAILAFGLSVTPVLAQASLNFDPAQLCAWQSANTGMDVSECTQLEDESKTLIADLEPSADSDRKEACAAEAKGFSGDSGFASYTLYATCLKDGPANP